MRSNGRTLLSIADMSCGSLSTVAGGGDATADAIELETWLAEAAECTGLGYRCVSETLVKDGDRNVPLDGVDPHPSWCMEVLLLPAPVLES